MAKAILTAAIICLSSLIAEAQVVRGASNTVTFRKDPVIVSFTKEATVTVAWSDSSGNGSLEAGEAGTILVRVANHTSEPLLGVQVVVTIAGEQHGLRVFQAQPLEILRIGTAHEFVVGLRASGQNGTNTVVLRIACSTSSTITFRYPDGQILEIDLEGAS